MCRGVLLVLGVAMLASPGLADDEVTEKTEAEKPPVQAVKAGAARRIERFEVVRAEGANQPGKPIEVQVGELIRVPLSAPSGLYDQFRGKATGNALFKAVNTVRTFVNGQPQIGATNKEFDLIVTGRGRIRVEVEARSSQPGQKPIKVEVEFDAK